jgi:predicted NBD/HSP70 family sugar kinase
MAPEQMHSMWTELLRRGAAGSSPGVSTSALGRVFARVMLAGGLSGAGVPRVRIGKGEMLLRPTTLAPGTVSKASAALLDAKLLTELKQTPGERGGPTLPLALDGTNWAVIGVHVEDRSRQLQLLHGVLTRLNGEEICQATETLAAHDPRDDEATLVDGVHALVETLLGEAGTIRQLLGIGIEVAGHVFYNGDIILETEGKNPDRLQIGKALADKLQLPIVIENDINARAIQALYHNQFKNLNAALIEVLDEGVGAALLIDGHIYRGSSGMAMEIGHLTVDYPAAPSAVVLGADTRTRVGNPGEQLRRFVDPCLCDSQAFGHVDTRATPSRIRGELGTADIEAAADIPGLAPEPDKPDTFRLSKEGAVFRQAGTALGLGLAQIVNIVNPGQLLLRLPSTLANAVPLSSGAQYLAAVESAISQSYSTGAQDARGETHRLTVEAVDPPRVAHDGARAAATAVLHRFIEHAVERDGCADRPRGDES